MPPAYQYNVGDIITTYDDRIGLVVERTDAHNYMAFKQNVTDPTIRSYMNIAIYKVLIDSSITYVNESNIRGIAGWERKKS